MKRLYFDAAATTEMSLKALDIYKEVAQEYIGNPSSRHQEGRKAAKRLATERAKTGELLGVDSRHIFYTSGATESNAIVLNSLLWKKKRGRVILSALEHSSITKYKTFLQAQGFEVIFVRAPAGYLDYEHLKQSLNDETQLVALLLVSNIFGTVQDLKRVSSLVKEKSPLAHLHCDGAQGPAKIEFNLRGLGIDSASFSAHKFHGPRGMGLLYLPSGSLQTLSPGGGQEGGIRGGTEPLPAIAALNCALEESLSDLEAKLRRGVALRALFEQEVAKIEGIEQLSPTVDSARAITPFILALSVKDFPGEVFSRILYDRGFCLSSGSACANNAPKATQEVFLEASFSPSQAKGSLRISFGPEIDENDLRALAHALRVERAKLNSRRSY
ncbi:MAG: aminotransferase class V-fold PLP-dependent enzyme [Sphaerochaetaceae bacterium]